MYWVDYIYRVGCGGPSFEWLPLSFENHLSKQVSISAETVDAAFHELARHANFMAIAIQQFR
jgi:hypothetical protein